MEHKDQSKYGHPYKNYNLGSRYGTQKVDSVNYQNRQEQIGRKHFGFKHLEELSDKEPSDIVFVICNQSNGFVDLFKQNKDPDWLFLLIKITAKICNTEFMASKRSILTEICWNSVFIDHLKSYVLTTPTEVNINRRLNMGAFFENCLTVCQSITDLFLKTAAERLNSLIICIRMALSDIKNNCIDLKINDIMLLEKIAKILQQFTNLKLNNGTKNDNKNELQNATPPEDFRVLSVYPTPFDIEHQRPFLRPNITKGAYQSVEHYLDVQFRLLHEDFIAPLREGIKCYKENNKNCNERRQRINNIRIYRNVQFNDQKVFVQDKLGYLINFNKNNKLKINWDISKRLMYGSLLLFTMNEFNDFFIGIVLGRDKKYLANGQLIVELIDDVQPDMLTSSFTMAESEVYFEPYKCAMQVLQNLNGNNFPMEKYIVSASNKVENPNYLKSLPEKTFNFNGEFNVLNDNEWPAQEKFGLDEMQYKAFKAALTNELTVIQGPPGTGKTFIGLMIIETIIKNLYHFHVPNRLKNPILVVCYTNHALDQFMEGIIKFTKNVVRIGGQTKSDIVKDYTLKNVTKYYRKSSDVFKTIRSATEIIKTMEHEITYLKNCKEFISQNAGILELSLLKNGMPIIYQNFFSSPIKYICWLFCDNEYFDFDPIDLIQNVELNTEHCHSEKILEVNNINDTEDENLHYENDDPDMVFKHQDIVIYSLTLKSVKDICERTINMLNDLKPKRMKRQYNVRYYSKNNDYNQNYQELETFCYRMERIHNYIKQMLSLADYNIKSDFWSTIPADLFKLKLRDRWLLYLHWVDITKNMFDPKIQSLEKNYYNQHKQYSELKELENIEILRNKHVVAMTTTGASKHRVLLEGLQSPIVVIEEAAEVLEAHIIASLTRHCQHLILIGDHKQLRPSTAVYKLAKEFHFDISLFERMVNSDVPYYALNEQHRMRPEVSSLITPVIYPNLLNHSSVLNRPHIRGVTKDIFFINHTNFETEVEEITSKSNDHEASFLIMFARHLILQDYRPDQVTILTTYSGQMFKLRSLQKQYSNLDGMKIQVVDNYQGEESDIILLSLVRSNENGNVGFLKTENRICVALSRARDGLYIMGNMENLYNSGNLWKEIKQKLVDQDAYGNELTLKCEVHRDTMTKVSKCEDFKPISEGGCTSLCNDLMKCGHYCSSVCHVYDREHKKIIICQQPCNRVCENNHPCEKKCAANCGECMVPMVKTLPCGHQTTQPCIVDSNEFKCEEKVEVLLETCGHKTIKKCYEKKPKCTTKCTDRLQCGHACVLNCHKDNDPTHEKYICSKQCSKLNIHCSQDHKCRKKCYEKCSNCLIKVDKILECGHMKKSVNCSDDIKNIQCSKHLPCNRILLCGHKCRQMCYEKCKECKVIITKTHSKCGHTSKIECQINPERNVICLRKCTRTMSCGHKCKYRCGNDCDPKKCKELISKEGKLACGHSKMWVYCCDADKEFDGNSQYVLDRCREPCLKMLLCGDLCSGTCGKCKQGRLHVPCEEMCNKINPCNHTCNYPCKEACPPCGKKCTYSCTHSRCPLPCSAPCVPCQESCVWKCKHFKCTKVCSDDCDRPPCYAPCQKKLKCEHKCIGFCGETCPPLCRICDEAEVTNIIFGYEDEPDARYVYLEDCKHTVESKGLEQWINQNNEEIALKQCPVCKMPILKTLRFKNHVKAVQKDICEIVTKLSGGRDQQSAVGQKEKALKRSVRQLNRSFRDIEQTSPRFKDVKNLWAYPSDQLLRCMYRITFAAEATVDLDSWTSTATLAESFFTYEKRIRDMADGGAKDVVVDHFVWLLTALVVHAGRLSRQQTADLNMEMARGARLVGLAEVKTDPNYAEAVAKQASTPQATTSSTAPENKVGDLVMGVEALLTAVGPYHQDADSEVQRLTDQVRAAIKSLVPLSEAERKMIHAAMSVSFHGRGRSQGHWLKCTNGHTYCVTECGGPMQRAKCPECKVDIGGENHRYANGTTVATEMDGAAHVAWSAANNMNNFVFD
ncbi:NFX1-type zinc finger-containing protein 1-like [Metopolophium dirhodum]|uniref:NFX1-type zinc finger-containing protein 1-like n=1 Tax=Metopolophium dirhodum TaxID=44670 RepID=UPI00299010CC|nr:NFX1-type zinc finger-containing protein 1-like [Metopolophium dirhodum]XP_060863747.1 NFX1-type zinc finger-containing protein 1-like [Metopolophium dirhodum]XP_060863748.1 NFX1-type zinc finger-containing protein 1-like [Metopolophium dirhodum]XP_060863749.1 NFX1-type zinc finger-containing protein 1-like [Metopolophium dirhodum]